MSKIFELDIFSRAYVSGGADFIGEVESIGRFLAGKRSSQYNRYINGDTEQAVANGLALYSLESLQYYYASLVAPYEGFRYMELFTAVNLLFPDIRVDGTIGGRDLIGEIKQKSGMPEYPLCATFDTVAVVKSARFPNVATLALAQKVQKVPLKTIANEAARGLSAGVPMFNEERALQLQQEHTIATTIPFARFKSSEVDEALMLEVVDAIVSNALEQPLHVKLDDIEHDFGKH